MKTFGIWIAALSITFTACSQEITASKVPSVVINTLQSKFAAATNVDWEKKKNIFEAEFNQDSVEHTVEIDPAGKVLRQKLDLSPAQLPAGIMQLINSQYKDFQPDDIEQVNISDMVIYQVELDAPRGKKDVKLVLNADGTTNNSAYWD